MHGTSISAPRRLRLAGVLAVLAGLLVTAIGAGAADGRTATFALGAQPAPNLAPTVTWAAAHDVSPPLRDLALGRTAPDADDPATEPDRGPISAADSGFSGDGAVQSALLPSAIPSPLQSFEGLSNQDNFNIFGFRVNPPDPNGEVGPNNYVEMVNLAFAVYDKSGNKLLGPVDTGTLWSGFAVPDCLEGGFLAALNRGAAYAEAARFANAVGALSVQKLGAINGIRSRAETEAWLQAKD